jgi:hypothetical protein
MSEEKIEKIINEKKQLILERFKHSLEIIQQESIKQFEAELERLKEITKIQLPAPLNVIDILNNGGYVFSNVFTNEYPGDFNVKISGHDVFNWSWSGGPILKAGKYRVTLIIERIENA